MSSWTDVFLTCGSATRPAQWVRFAQGLLQDEGRGLVGTGDGDLFWLGYSRDSDAVLDKGSPSPTPLPAGNFFLLRIGAP